MKVAIMQPYIFPYIGYFNLVHSVDKFIFFDDVNFIKRGWINRNKIISNKSEFLFSVPLKKASQNKLINDTYVSIDQKWKNKLLKTIKYSYEKEESFPEIYSIIEGVLHSDVESIADLSSISVVRICDYLDIQRDFQNSSSISSADISASGQDRILSICKNVGAKIYNNAIGGVSLYSKELFESNKIKLNFVKPKIKPYAQNSNQFISNLSIIDVLMYNSKKDVIKMIESYELI